MGRKMKLIDNWKQAWKLKSVQVGALSAFFYALILLSEQFLNVWAVIPQELMKGVGSHQVFTVKDASFDTLWRKLRDKCEIEDLHFHDSRHEACTRLARKLEVLDLARMIGHKDLRSLMVYYNATASEIANRLD